MPSASPGARTPPTAISPSPATASATNCCRCWRAGIRGCASTWRRWPTLARDEEAWWQAELARVASAVAAARQAGARRRPGCREPPAWPSTSPGWPRSRRPCSAACCATPPSSWAPRPILPPPKPCRALALTGRAGQKCELQGLRAERTPRELRLERGQAAQVAQPAPASYCFPVPGEVEAPAFALRLRVETSGARSEPDGQKSSPGSDPAQTATLRNWKPGDRVRLRHSGSPRKVKEILERLRVTGSERALWPVLELDGRIIWMKGAELEPEPGLKVQAEGLDQMTGKPFCQWHFQGRLTQRVRSPRSGCRIRSVSAQLGSTICLLLIP